MDISSHARKQPFGPWLGYVMLVNSAVGTGVMQLPRAYREGGWVVALTVEVVFLALGLVMNFQLVEINERVKVLYSKEQESAPKVPQELWGVSLHSEELQTIARPSHSQAFITHPDPQFDLVQMVRLVLGKGACTVYLITLTVYMEGALITYVSAFGNAIAEHSNTDWESATAIYYVSTVGFLALMLYLSLIGLRKQTTIQAFLGVVRLALAGCILVLSVYILGAGRGQSIEPSGEFIDVGRSLAVLVFAGMYHCNVPTVLRSTRPACRKRVFLNVTFTLLLWYPLLGMTAGFANTLTIRYVPPDRGLVRVLRFLVGILPAFVSVSIFPIYISSINDNLLAFLYGPCHKSKTRGTKSVKIALKVLCLSCPFFYCFVTPKLVSSSQGTLATGVGTVGSLVSYFTINLLHCVSRWKTKEEGMEEKELKWWPSVSATQWASALTSAGSVAIFVILISSQVSST